MGVALAQEDEWGWRWGGMEEDSETCGFIGATFRGQSFGFAIESTWLPTLPRHGSWNGSITPPPP